MPAGGLLTVAGSGLQPGEQAQVWLHSDPVLLATVTATDTGDLSVSVRIPAGTPVGTHTIELVAASGATGEAAITVTAAASSAGVTTGTYGTSGSSGGQLSYTGFPTSVFAVGAAALVAFGALLLVASRRRSRPQHR